FASLVSSHTVQMPPEYKLMTKKKRQGLMDKAISRGGGSELVKDRKRAPRSVACNLPPPNNENSTVLDETFTSLPCA
ncbi:MAG TPA: hypothetical protein VK619_18115, partial [Pyrinomonadaceae bacterium]|nr:hypothetical protein [Pyrinomonadaceae bacterium]